MHRICMSLYSEISSINMAALFFLRNQHLPIITALLLLCWPGVCHGTPDPRLRDALMQQEASRQTGGRLLLSEAEQTLSARLHKLKEQEMQHPQFPPAMHFFKARTLIQQSPIFSLLQKMPKGAALHVHSFSLVDAEWLVKNVTYRPHCYICIKVDQSVQFRFSFQQPCPLPQCYPWMLLETVRGKVDNVTEFDNSLMQNLTLFTVDPETAYPSQDVVWEKFEQTFIATAGLVSYAPVFREYFYKGLQQLYEDNIMYLELRSGLSQTYELDGSTHDRAWCLRTYQDVTRQFMAQYPEFIGTRIIFSVHRSLSISEVKERVVEAIDLRKQFPEMMAGFDLVGREDTGQPLWYFREALSLPAERGVNLPYFFHAGETDQEGTQVDGNLLDALLFNTTRIGHGFALVHHPLTKELSRKTGVPMEVCPISNQVLKLVSDLRNHPAAVLMSEGHPLVISSDDPACFGATGLSYDFYEAFVGIGGLSSHLGTLKELAMNSIRFSSLSPQLKDKALTLWQTKWEKFVSENSQ